jgi:hypothetical protein
VTEHTVVGLDCISTTTINTRRNGKVFAVTVMAKKVRFPEMDASLLDKVFLSRDGLLLLTRRAMRHPDCSHVCSTHRIDARSCVGGH